MDLQAPVPETAFFASKKSGLPGLPNRPLLPVLHSARALHAASGVDEGTSPVRCFHSLTHRSHNPNDSDYHRQARLGFRRARPTNVRLRPLDQVPPLTQSTPAAIPSAKELRRELPPLATPRASKELSDRKTCDRELGRRADATAQARAPSKEVDFAQARVPSKDVNFAQVRVPSKDVDFGRFSQVARPDTVESCRPDTGKSGVRELQLQDDEPEAWVADEAEFAIHSIMIEALP